MKKGQLAALFVVAGFSVANAQVTGSGTGNMVTRWIPGTTPSYTMGNSQITDNGSSFIGLGATAALGTEYVTITHPAPSSNWNAVRVYNPSTTSGAGSTICSSVGASGSVNTIGINAYGSITASGMFQSNTGVLNGNGSAGMNIGTTSNTQLSLWTNNTKRVAIDNNGLVGIANAAPTCRLDVTGSSIFGGMVARFKNVSSNYATFFTTQGCAGCYNPLTLANDNGIYFDNGTAGNTPGGGLVIAPWNNTGGSGMRIDGLTGNVSVGTASAPAKLTVNGNVLIGDPATVTMPAGYKMYVQTGILTEKVKVALVGTSDWADYVFEKNYELKSLEEVKAFIEKNKHLPGVPSAAELVEQGGIDLAKMDAKLMEKIEELTLYILELHKEIEQLKKENKN